MEYPKYLVHISYFPNRANGQTLQQINGVTQSVPAYSGAWYIASMPELNIAATGSDYSTALTNLLNIATASTTADPGNPPLSVINRF